MVCNDLDPGMYNQGLAVSESEASHMTFIKICLGEGGNGRKY